MLENIVSLGRGTNSNSSLSTYYLQPSVLPLNAMPLGRGALHCRGDVDLTGGGHCMSGHVPRADMCHSVCFASAVFQGSCVRVSSLPALELCVSRLLFSGRLSQSKIPTSAL